MKKVVFKDKDGNFCVLIPTGELSLEETIEKDLPPDTKYILTDTVPEKLPEVDGHGPLRADFFSKLDFKKASGKTLTVAEKEAIIAERIAQQEAARAEAEAKVDG